MEQHRGGEHRDMPQSPLPRQAVFLVGGRGSRLGALTDDAPKPMLTVGDRPFLDHLIGEAGRFGIERVLLLCGYRAGHIADHYAGRRFDGVTLDMIVETEPAGTGGAVRHAADRLDEVFFLANGDSCFDINWLDLAAWDAGKEVVGRMALRAIPPGGRYGRVTLDNGRVTAFHAASDELDGPMNAGLYFLRRDVLDWIERVPCSLEQDVFPRLASAGRLAGRVYDRFFLDIGVPDDYERSQTEVPAFLHRPAAFLRLDCLLHDGLLHDGLLHDGGLRWMPGARAAVKRLNDNGYYVFVIGEGLAARGAAIRRIAGDLRAIGGHLDDVVQGVDGVAGAIGQCLERWPAKPCGSFLATGRRDDLTASAAAGLPAYLIAEGGLPDVVAALT
jgi:dTDP-glucose pyrophosphorylase